VALPAALQAVYAATNAKETLTIPNTLNVGAAYRVIKPLLVTFTWTLDRWRVYDGDVFTASNGAVIPVPRDYRNGHTLRGGAEYDVVKAVTVRAGVQRDISGLRTETYSPTLPDGSSWAGSLGATYRFAHGVSIDAGVFYAKMDKVTATNTGLEPNIYPAAAVPPTGVLPVPQPGTTLRGSYEPSALVYGLSVGWTPGYAAAAR
jgi:long-chain fatty acid transport protein